MFRITSNYTSWVNPYNTVMAKPIVFNLFGSTLDKDHFSLSDYNSLSAGAGIDVIDFLNQGDRSKNFAVVTCSQRTHLLELIYDNQSGVFTCVCAHGRNITKHQFELADTNVESKLNELAETLLELDITVHHVDEIMIGFVQVYTYDLGLRYRYNASAGKEVYLVDDANHYTNSKDIANSIHFNMLSKRLDKSLAKQLKGE